MRQYYKKTKEDCVDPDDSDDEWNLWSKLISRHSISMIRSYWQVWNKYGHYNRALSASFYIDCHISYSIMERNKHFTSKDS